MPAEGGQANPGGLGGQLSILYLRCGLLGADAVQCQTLLLSILYLRCMYVPERDAGLVVGLSILYLRCREAWNKEACKQLSPSFNSLFEMLAYLMDILRRKARVHFQFSI